MKYIRKYVRIALLLAACLYAPVSSFAGGCGCVPVSLPAGEAARYHFPGALRASYAFNYSDTDHYYIEEERDPATETNVAPATPGIDHVLGIEYDLPRGFALLGEVPFLRNEQSREFGGVKGTMEASGLGDVRLLARYWVPAGSPNRSWFASVGVRLPTGESDGTFKAANGKTVTRDLAAQAGTGNPAGILEVGGSTLFGGRFALGLQARYIFTPEATTVRNFRNQLTGNGPEMNSDSDAASARVSLSSPLSTGTGALSRLAARVNADVAWVPYTDLIGDTEGFRRAGPILFVGPGVSWAPRQALSLSAAVPFTVYRNIQQNGGNVQEWTVQFSMSYDVFPGRG